MGMPVTVVFDADCGICQASVAWIKRRARPGQFVFVGNDVEALPAGVSREETEHTLVVLDGAAKSTRADGVGRILRELRFWGLPAALLRTPGLRQLANLGYDQFAKRRHRVSAALGLTACAVPHRATPPKPLP